MRYRERANRPKPIFSEERKLKKRSNKYLKESDDDEMPQQKPKTRKNKTNSNDSKIRDVDVITLDSNPAPVGVSTATLPASQPMTSSEIEETVFDNADSIGASSERNEENKDPVGENLPLEQTVEQKPLDVDRQFLMEHALRGRLPKWYHTRRLQEEEQRKRNAEKKELRLKMEKELEEAKKKEEKIEERKKKDRERKRLKTIQNRMKNGEVIDEQMIKERYEKLDENMRKHEEKNHNRITVLDPSFDPSLISLGAVEIAPWAKKSKIKKESGERTMPMEPSDDQEQEKYEVVDNSFENSFEDLDLNDMFLDLENIPTCELTSLLVDLNDMDLSFYLEETGDFMEIPEEEIEPIDGNNEIDDTFLNIMNDDTFVLDPVQAFNQSQFS